jgi:hypothetical protein
MKAAKTKGNLELFSHLAHFLHFIGRQFTRATIAFSTFISAKKGERCKKYPVHHVVHLRVHLSEPSNSRKKRKLNTRRCEFWARAKHRSGLERPHFFIAGAPKKVFGVVPAQLAGLKEARLHTSTT